MGSRNEIKLLLGTCILMVVAMFLLPFTGEGDQSIVRNTLYELASGSSTGSLVMNLIFAALACSSAIAGWKSFEGSVFQKITLALFCVSLALSAFFNKSSAESDIYPNVIEDEIHSYFVCTTWMNFTIMVFSTTLLLKKKADRLISSLTGISVILLLLLVAESVCAAGLWNRLLFILSFGWMIYIFKILEGQKRISSDTGKIRINV